MLLSLLFVVLSGIALPVGGIQMQYLWRNQLGDVYSLGLGSAACLGAAAATMSGVCSLTVGSFVCTLICTIICVLVALKINTQQLITFGILFGTLIGSLGTIVVTNAPNGDLLKKYYLWGAANFNMEGVTTGDVIFALVLFAIGMVAALASARGLTAHMKGETELSQKIKALLLLAIMFLVPSAVSICGPIGFISPPRLQGHGHQEALCDFLRDGNRASACHVPRRQVRQFRHLSADQRNHGDPIPAFDGINFHKEVGISYLWVRTNLTNEE